MLVCHVLYANGDSAEKQIEAKMFLHKWWLEIDCEKNHCSVSVCKASVSVSVGEARKCSEELKRASQLLIIPLSNIYQSISILMDQGSGHL